MTSDSPAAEIIYEFHPVGNVVRVSAMHVASLTEVIVVCPRGLSPQMMKNRALQKLKYVMNKEKNV